MKKNIICGALFMSICAFSQSSKETKVRELIKVMQVDKIAIEGAKQMIALYSESQKDVPQSFWKEFQKEIKSEDLINMYVPIYMKHYSEEDVDGMLTFYKSAVGQKVINSTPAVMEDSMEAGKEWGQKIGMKLVERMNKAKGLQEPPRQMPSK